MVRITIDRKAQTRPAETIRRGKTRRVEGPSRRPALVALLLLSAGALASAPALSFPESESASTATAPVLVAQTPPDQPERSPEQREAERRLEQERDDLEDRIDQERDDFEESDEGADARDRIERAREEMERRKAELERQKDEVRDETSCCNPGYADGIIRYLDRQIEELEEEFEREREDIIDEEMEENDEDRAETLDELERELRRVEGELERLRDLPPLPPPGLTQGGFPDDGGVVVLAMLPGVSFAGAGDPGSDPRVLQALMDQSRVIRVPTVPVPWIPTIQPQMPSIEVVPAPRPPMEVIPR